MLLHSQATVGRWRHPQQATVENHTLQVSTALKPPCMLQRAKLEENLAPATPNVAAIRHAWVPLARLAFAHHACRCSRAAATTTSAVAG